MRFRFIFLWLKGKAMSNRKLLPNDVSFFIDGLENKTRRDDAKTLLEMFGRVTGEAPRLWPSSIIGFGQYHYRYASGHEGDSLNVGFSPRKSNLVMYVMGSVGSDHPLMQRLGKHKTGKACLYVKKLADIDLSVLEKIILISYKTTIEKYC
jgi:hypothetical protein